MIATVTGLRDGPMTWSVTPDGSGARDDTEAIAEVLTRRFRHYRAAREQRPDGTVTPSAPSAANVR